MEQLNLSSFNQAIHQLEENLRYFASETVQKDKGLVLQLRAAGIQAFEFTYELAWKMLKRYLEITEPNPQTIEEMTFPQLIRTGSEKGLLLNAWPKWKKYRDARNITSHSYDVKKAIDVFSLIPDFLKDAKFLSTEIQKRFTV